MVRFASVAATVLLVGQAALAANPPPPSKDEILQSAAAVTKAANLACTVADAALLNQGTATINGKAVQIRTFETACSNGLGYFVVEQAPEPTIAISCFSAEVNYNADIAAKREPQPRCSLPANADTKIAAANALKGLGQSCNATAVRVIGIDTAANNEITEVACNGGSGFVLSIPQTGKTPTALTALSCPDSYRRGVACRLSSNGAPIITLETFKQALVQHKVACTPVAVRLIGRENKQGRHVVEFKCPEQPDGLVAFIPIEQANAPFETMDCATAGSRVRVICTMNQLH